MSDHFAIHAGTVDDPGHWSSHATGAPAVVPGHSHAAPPVLALDAITPDNGPSAGGTLLTLTGTAFSDVIAVNMEVASVTDFVIVNDTTMTLVSPPAPGAGEVDVEVVNTNDDVGRLLSGYTYT